MVGFTPDILKSHNDRLSLYSYINETSPFSFYKDEKYVFVENFEIWSKYIEKLNDGTLEPDIAEFKGTEILVNIANYQESDYYDETSDRGRAYKVEKILDLIRSDPYYYALYLSKLIGTPDTFFLTDTDIDGTKRRRMNNFNEVEDTSLREEFDEPHRLYVIRRDNNYTKMVFTINGKNIVPKIYSDDKFNYIYIPYSEVPEPYYTNGVYLTLEIEKIYDHRYSRKIQPNNDSESFIMDGVNYTGFNLTVPDDSGITPRDIYFSFLTDEGADIFIPRIWTNDANEEVILYKILEKRNDGKIVDISTPATDFMTYDNILFVPMDGIAEFITHMGLQYDDDIMVHMDRINITHHIKGDNVFNYYGRLNPDVRNLQIFKNGLLIPDVAYGIYFDKDNLYGPHSFKAAVAVMPYDVFTFTYSRHKRVKVYSAKTVPENGYVDLGGILSKPFSLRWYDVYMNGLKLDMSHIKILSPFKILITNFESNRNLVIYQKNLDLGDMSQPIHVDGQVVFKNPQDDWIKNYDWIRESLIGDNKLNDNLPDIIEDIVSNLFGFLKEYLGTRWGLLNPDLAQITTEMVNKFPSVFDGTTDVFVNPDHTDLILDRNYYMDPDTKQDLLG